MKHSYQNNIRLAMEHFMLFLVSKVQMVIKLKIYDHNIPLYVGAYLDCLQCLVLAPICLCFQNDQKFLAMLSS